jgi:hypothetical protein
LFKATALYNPDAANAIFANMQKALDLFETDIRKRVDIPGIQEHLNDAGFALGRLKSEERMRLREELKADPSAKMKK